MRAVVESLKRLYKSGKITKKKVQAMQSITEEEKTYIVAEDG